MGKTKSGCCYIPPTIFFSLIFMPRHALSLHYTIAEDSVFIFFNAGVLVCVEHNILH